jgi:hypothetical protein
MAACDGHAGLCDTGSVVSRTLSGMIVNMLAYQARRPLLKSNTRLVLAGLYQWTGVLKAANIIRTCICH